MKQLWSGLRLILILLAPLSLAQSAPTLTPESLRAALKTKPTGT